MSTISPQETQYYKELVTPFQPMGRLLIGSDLRGTQCNRFGQGNLMLVGYGDSSGGYAFSPKNQDAAIAPSLSSAVLSNIANAIPRLTEAQDMAGKWIDTITLHALDEFIEQVEPQSFIANTLRIFAGGQKDFRGDGTGNRNIRNTFTLLAEVPIPALTRADIPRSFNVKACVYIPPAQNIYLGLAIPQPYTCSFEMWDLQANTQTGSGFSNTIGGSSSVADGNDLNEDITNPSTDTQFLLPIRFSFATWRLGNGFSVRVPPPSTTPPPSFSGSVGNNPGSPSSPSTDSNGGQPSASSGSKPSRPSSTGRPSAPPSEGGCSPIQDCQWYTVSSAQSASVDINLGGATALCPAGMVARGIVDFETSGSFVLCCSATTFPPNNLGCSSLTKWSCVGGTCVEDVLGTYNSQAECEAALVPPTFTGGQCVGGSYYVQVQGVRTSDGSTFTSWNSGSGSPTGSPNGLTNLGPISGLNWSNSGSQTIWRVQTNGVDSPFLNGFLFFNSTSLSIIQVIRTDGIDNCGNPPSSCP